MPTALASGSMKKHAGDRIGQAGSRPRAGRALGAVLLKASGEAATEGGSSACQSPTEVQRNQPRATQQQKAGGSAGQVALENASVAAKRCTGTRTSCCAAHATPATPDTVSPSANLVAFRHSPWPKTPPLRARVERACRSPWRSPTACQRVASVKWRAAAPTPGCFVYFSSPCSPRTMIPSLPQPLIL